MKRLAGARIWAQWNAFPLGYSLWEYQGPYIQNDSILHKFTPYRTQGVEMYRTTESFLRGAKTFRPFLIDTEALDASS